MKTPDVILIAAMDRNGVIGKENQLPWKLSADLKLFKKLTSGHPILMGRKTWDSIGRPLPNRRNLILTRQQDFSVDGTETVHSVEEALTLLKGSDRLFVIGGEEIYRLCLARSARMFITLVDTEVVDGDAKFPEWDPEDYHILSEESFKADERNQHDFRVIEYAQKNPTL